MYLSSDLYQLHRRRPTGIAIALLAGWAAMFALYVVSPAVADRLLWDLSREAFSWTGALLLPVAWGPSSNISVLGLALGALVFWFFGSDLEFRLGRRRFGLYLLTASLAGFAVAWLWTRAFAGGVATFAPNLAWAAAWAAVRLHRDKTLAWKNYGLGRIAILQWVMLGALAVRLLLAWVGDEALDQALGAVATVLVASFFLEPRWPLRLRAWWILRRNRFGRKRNRWGYN